MPQPAPQDPERPAPAEPEPQSPAPESPEDTPADPGGAEPTAPLTQPTITLERTNDAGEKKVIEIVKTGPDEAGIAAICSPLEGDPEGTPTRFVYFDTSPTQVRVTVDKNVITAPMAIAIKQPDGDGNLEMGEGTARYLEPEEVKEGATDPLERCEVFARLEKKQDIVKVVQGKTNLSGSYLTYSEDSGLAKIEGPITFAREQKDDRLNGTSDAIVVDVENERTTLTGNVTLKSKDRTSTAAEVEYDDTRNIAILRGTPENPARSQSGKDVLRAISIRYNLETNDVVASNPVGSTFQDGGEESDGASP
ncbi:hypothetical protein HNR42_002733 [Deinobacterium chartae]|uniref:Organic solvent tolerance-like N-terminal domain-containing protein n=1 Tax=Deinobacterium chartae TaxID=521158 RepID=A0A841I604_9DEIO|nr:LptA/OstA family protein [Deinobacterium chartae]MBB6099295.1 hypothetical protein [Deinobacterium chartae]